MVSSGVAVVMFSEKSSAQGFSDFQILRDTHSESELAVTVSPPENEVSEELEAIE